MVINMIMTIRATITTIMPATTTLGMATRAMITMIMPATTTMTILATTTQVMIMIMIMVMDTTITTILMTSEKREDEALSSRCS